MALNTAPHILLRSSWQMANIGDMAHAPGSIRLLRETDPDLRITLWARRISDDEGELLQSWFPGLDIVLGDLDADGVASTVELEAAIAAADALVHGSGRLWAGEPDVVRWADRTGKPYGFMGITVDPLSPDQATNLTDMAALVAALGADDMPERRHELLREARFVRCRDSVSADHLARHGLADELTGFGPDAVFAFQHEDAAGADVLADELDLPSEGFVCVIPRLRWSPYHHMLGTPIGHTERLKDAVNAVYRELEVPVLIETINRVVREHGRTVLLAPEMTYAPQLSAEIAALLDDDVASSVRVMDRFWGPATAMSTYARAAAVVSMECHSPILATRVGTPSVYLRQPTDTIKGQMWADLGLGDRVHELETPDPASVADQVSGFLVEQENHRSLVHKHAAAAEDLLRRQTAEGLPALLS